MPYHLSDDGPPSTRYRQYVKARLFRTHGGLSIRGLIGIAILVIFSIVAIVAPHRTSDTGGHAVSNAGELQNVGGRTGEANP